MHRSLLLAGSLLMGGIALLAPAQIEAGPASPPTCLDVRTQITHTATKWISTPGTLTGTNGSDVLVGSPGTDVIRGLGGDDIICGGGGSDSVDAGTGNDSVLAWYSPDDSPMVHGGSGDDAIKVSGSAHGDAGNDHIEAVYGTAWGDTGNDAINLNGGLAAYGGAGDDYIIIVGSNLGDGGSGNDLVIGLYGESVIKGGSGNDTLRTTDDFPAQRMDGGSGHDTCEPLGIPYRSCEIVQQR